MRLLAVFLILIAVCQVAPVWAADSYQVTTSTWVEIDEHGTCRQVKSKGGTLFVPTATSGEWSAFRTNATDLADMVACCGGYKAGGYCWRLGANHESCTEVCDSRGGRTDGLNDYITTAARCHSILAGLGYSTRPTYSVSCGDNYHQLLCTMWGTDGDGNSAVPVNYADFPARLYCSNSAGATSGALSIHARRACSCLW